MDRRWSVLVGVLLLAGCATGPGADVADSVESGAGAPAALTFDDAVTLTNGEVRLSVSPRVGRVVAFGREGGQSLLWVNDTSLLSRPFVGPDGQRYFNYGGDKLWVGPQPLWGRARGVGEGWPPDGVIDGRPWRVVERSARRLVIESAVSERYGLRARRTIELPAAGPGATITNTLTRVEANPLPVQIWTVTQVRTPPVVLLDIAGDRVGGRAPWERMSDAAALEAKVTVLPGQAAAAWRTDGEGSGKVGTLGRWVAAVYGDEVFVQRTGYDPAGAYPEASNVQAYSDDRYTELELLSPLVYLRVGESLSNRVAWSLVDRPAGASVADVAEMLEERQPIPETPETPRTR